MNKYTIGLLVLFDLVFAFMAPLYEMVCRLPIIFLILNQYFYFYASQPPSTYGIYFKRALMSMFIGDQIILLAAYQENEELFRYCILFYWIGHVLLLSCYLHNLAYSPKVNRVSNGILILLMALCLVVFGGFVHFMAEKVDPFLWLAVQPYAFTLVLSTMGSLVMSNHACSKSAFYAILGHVVFLVSDGCIGVMMFLDKDLAWVMTPLSLSTYLLSIQCLVTSGISHLQSVPHSKTD